MQINPVHIAFCVNNLYVSYIAVTIKSLVENYQAQGGILIHVLTDYISKTNRYCLKEIVNKYSYVALQIHEIDDVLLKNLRTNSWTIYAWYRILLPNVLSIDINKVLYLDADTLVIDDLEDLFALDMTDKAVAGTLDPQAPFEEPYVRCGYDSGKQYICSGVLLMNLDYWREHQLTEKIINWAKTNAYRLKYPDEDAINYICQDSKIVLPLRYNVMNYFFLENIFYRQPYIEQLKECLQHPAIIHYAGWYPWVKDGMQHCMCNMWLQYNKMLRHPAKRIYHSKGWTLLKIRIWDLFHPKHERIIVTIADIEQDLLSSSQS